MLVPSAAVVKQFVQTILHKLLARGGAALGYVTKNDEKKNACIQGLMEGYFHRKEAQHNRQQ